MSREILKIGTDVLTLNDKLVSVTEDYPFWKVNGSLNSQYYRALLSDFREQASVLSSNTVWTGSATSCSEAILAPNGFVYGVPAGVSSIPKFNPSTNTTSYIGSLGAAVYSGAKLVGDIIYMFPGNTNHILKLDTRTDFITLIGTFSGTNQFSTPAIGQDGKIYCLGLSAQQVLEFNPVDDTYILHTTTGEANMGSAVSGDNGFIYGAPRVLTTGTFPYRKFNIVTKTYTTIAGGNVAWSSSRRGINVNGIIFFHSSTGTGSGNIYYINTTTDVRNQLTLAPGASTWSGLTQGADGWVYVHGADNVTPSYRFNPYNFTVQQVEIATTNHRGTGALLADGRILFPSIVGNQVRTFLTTSQVNSNLSTNRILSRYQQ